LSGKGYKGLGIDWMFSDGLFSIEGSGDD